MKMYFADLKQKQVLSEKGLFDIKELIDFFSKKFPEIYKSNNLITDAVAIDKMSHIPQHNPQKWEQVIATNIFILSGQIPSREEVKKGRQIIEALPKYVRAKITPKDVFTIFPYLLSGFKTEMGRASFGDSNSINDVANVVEKLCGDSPIKIRSYFCAHRDRKESRKNYLTDDVSEEHAIKVMNLTTGLIMNTKHFGGEIIWTLANGSALGVNGVFPNIFNNYVKTEGLGELVRSMNLHYEQMSNLLVNNSPTQIKSRIENYDLVYKNVEELVLQYFGSDWRKGDIAKCPDKKLAKVIFGAEKDLSRITSSYNISNLDLVENEFSNIIRIYKQNASTSVIGKAIFETMFYYDWGAKAKKENSMAFGFDRDHNLYQTEGFKLGYSGDINPAPMIYARRTNDEKSVPLGNLNDLSFRQFWRVI